MWCAVALVCICTGACGVTQGSPQNTIHKIGSPCACRFAVVCSVLQLLPDFPAEILGLHQLLFPQVRQMLPLLVQRLYVQLRNLRFHHVSSLLYHVAVGGARHFHVVVLKWWGLDSACTSPSRNTNTSGAPVFGCFVLLMQIALNCSFASNSLLILSGQDVLLFYVGVLVGQTLCKTRALSS